MLAFPTSPTVALPGVATRPVGVGGAEADWMLRLIEVELLRVWASEICTGSVFGPSAVAPFTVALYEKTLSNGATSPFEPSSKNVWDALRPMELRSATTVMPVLGGFCPGVTVTVR